MRPYGRARSGAPTKGGRRMLGLGGSFFPKDERAVIVDTHVHPMAADRERYPRSGAQLDAEWIQGTHLTAEEFIEQMDRAGVDQAVLVQGFTAHGYDNSYCADSAAAYPQRFVAVCRVDPAQPDAPDKLRYWVEERGCRGVRLGEGGTTGVDNPWLADPKSDALWERAEELGIPVCLQLRKTDLARVGPLLERFAGVTVLLDHLAHASLDDLTPLARYPNLHLKFSTMNIREAAGEPGFFFTLVREFGVDRLLWSSDFPHTKGTAEEPYKACVDLARDLLAPLSDHERWWIMGETARKVYPDLKKDGPPL